MKKEEIARFLWDVQPRIIKNLLRFLWNLFPLEIERFDDFIQRVRESKQPVEIEKIDEPVISSNEYHTYSVIGRKNEYYTYSVIGRRFAVKLISFASDGKKIVHRTFDAFLAADANGQVDENEDGALTQRLSYEMRKILQYLNLKKIPVKINGSN